MRDYYTDFLQTKNSVNTLPSEVSKVSKGQNESHKNPFDTFDTPLTKAKLENFISKEIIFKCSNCGLEMNLIENNSLWFCPIGCQSIKAEAKL